MENASKGLLIAGSILIAIVIIGMLFYFFNSLSEYPKAQEEERQKEQVTKFNKEYESYDKKKMYGQDVVTIINKAINNNNSYRNKFTGEMKKDDSFYYIDVEVTLLSEIRSYAEVYKQEDMNVGTVTSQKYVSMTPVYSGTVGGIQLGVIFPKGSKFYILQDIGDSVTTNSTIENFFNSFETKKVANSDGKLDEFNYTMIYSGFTDFKRKYFQCTGIEYDKVTGRVNKLIFQEIPSS